jgi:methylated-DNA-[protein]-cysteine S-methyltransferase
MASCGYTLFDTSVGRCGIAWGERGVVCLQLPERSPAATRGRLLQRLESLSEAGEMESAVPEAICKAIAAITALLQGEPRDLREIELDMREVPDFARKVYDAARLISPGETLTYGEVARKIGSPGAARAVGMALGHNPFAIIVPCHRVLAAGGGSGGFSAHGGVRTKWRLLEIERAAHGGQLALPIAAKPRG